MRLPLRKLVFWLHLLAAVSLGLVVLSMAATGLLLAFESQILELADRGVLRVAAPPQPPPTPELEALLTAVAAHDATLAPTSVTVYRDPERAVALALGREGVAYADPHRGVVAGRGSARAREAMRTITELHRYLAAAGDRRPLGKSVTGASNLAFLFILLSGLYLWVPRVLDRVRLRNVLWFRGGLTAKARDFNWHHVFGFWMWAPLILIVVSAVPMSYTWGNDLVFRVTGSPAPPKPGGPGGPNGPGSRPPAPPSSPESTAPLAAQNLDGLDGAVARAIAQIPAWQSFSLRLPLAQEGPITVTVDESDHRGRPDLRTTFVVDRSTGELVKTESFADQNAGRRARSWMRWIHTGEVAGVPGQIVAALACAATLLLGWTGFALALRRLSAWLYRDAIAFRTSIQPTARFPVASRGDRDVAVPGDPLREKADT